MTDNEDREAIDLEDLRAHAEGLSPEEISAMAENASRFFKASKKGLAPKGLIPEPLPKYQPPARITRIRTEDLHVAVNPVPAKIDELIAENRALREDTKGDRKIAWWGVGIGVAGVLVAIISLWVAIVMD